MEIEIQLLETVIYIFCLFNSSYTEDKTNFHIHFLYQFKKIYIKTEKGATHTYSDFSIKIDAL